MYISTWDGTRTFNVGRGRWFSMGNRSSTWDEDVQQDSAVSMFLADEPSARDLFWYWRRDADLPWDG